MKVEHIKILKFLAEHYDPVENVCFYGFKSIAAETGLDVKQVRRSCRYLRRKGFTQFAKGLWNYDGEPMGSGYAATELGVKHVAM